jgi:hypothetical protein
MKQEIHIALDLLTSYVQRYGSIKEESLEQFRTELEKVLLDRYQGHWYPGKISSNLFVILLLTVDYFR